MPISMARGLDVYYKKYAFVFQTQGRPLTGLPMPIYSLYYKWHIFSIFYAYSSTNSGINVHGCSRIPLYCLISRLPPRPPPPPSFAPQRKRKADGGFTVPSAKSRSAQAPPHPHPTGSSRGASSSSSSHARGGCASAATAASSSCAQQHQEEEVEESCRRGGGSLRERSNREASRKIGIGREALERLKRCNVPPSVVSEHDVDDRDDPVSCAEYVVDMYKRFKELEVSEAKRSGPSRSLKMIFKYFVHKQTPLPRCYV